MEKETKRVIAIAIVALLVLASMIFAEYLMPEFKVSKSNDKMIAVTAKNARAGAVLTDGCITVAEGDLILYSSDLTKGKIRMDLYELDEAQKEKSDRPTISLSFQGGDMRGREFSMNGPTGIYRAVITCDEEATGSVWMKTLSAR